MTFNFKVKAAFLIFGWITLVSSCIGQQSTSHKQRLPKNTVEKIESDTSIGSRVTVIYQDQSGTYWFGGGSQGVYRYDGQNITLFGLEDGLCSTNILGIQEDHAGNIFFDTTVGVCTYNGDTFSTLKVKQAKAEWNLAPDDLWFRMGWNTNGPYRYDGHFLYFLEFPKIPLAQEFYKKFPNASFTPYGIYTMHKDRKGNIWFGTSTLGACRYDGKSHQWISESEMTELDDGPAPGVRSILEDHEGNLWFSSNISHKYKVLDDSLRVQNNAWTYEILKGMDTSVELNVSDSYMAITQDSLGHFWMASYNEGVWKYDGSKFIHYPVSDAGENILIFSIYKDLKGVLWLGTHNAGAMKFNGDSFEKFKL